MRTRTLVVLVALSLSIGAAQAATKKPEPGAKSSLSPTLVAQFKKKYHNGVLCDHAACTTVMVTVKPGKTGKTECTITPLPPLGMVKDFRNVITWKIDAKSGKAKFTRKGINPKEPRKDWDQEFDGEKPGDTEFVWYDKNPNDSGNGNRELGYNVEVTLGDQSCRLDPIIINDVHG